MKKNKVKYLLLLMSMTLLCACNKVTTEAPAETPVASPNNNQVSANAVSSDGTYNIPGNIASMDYFYQEFNYNQINEKEDAIYKLNSDASDNNGKLIVNYDRYLEICEDLDLDVNYNDASSNYGVICYSSFSPIHATVYSYIETGDTVNLFLSEEEDESLSGRSFYIIIFPISQNINDISFYLCEDGKTHAVTSLDRTQGSMLDKPVIYLYPEEETDVTVLIDESNINLTCTYPQYNNGWNVHAAPDGTLTGSNGMEYNYLYWEGISQNEWDFSTGFCVKGEDTATFLEENLEKLGLSRSEANEFIVYWLPLMENNEYNVISFQQEAYTDIAGLTVYPAPDSTIRVFMTWYPSDEYVSIPEQTINTPAREGFTLVEWGGSIVNPAVTNN